MIHWIKVIAITMSFFVVWTLLALTYQWIFYGFSNPFWFADDATPLSFLVMLLAPTAIVGIVMGVSHILKGDL